MRRAAGLLLKQAVAAARGPGRGGAGAIGAAHELGLRRGGMPGALLAGAAAAAVAPSSHCRGSKLPLPPPPALQPMQALPPPRSSSAVLPPPQPPASAPRGRLQGSRPTHLRVRAPPLPGRQCR